MRRQQFAKYGFRLVACLSLVTLVGACDLTNFFGFMVGAAAGGALNQPPVSDNEFDNVLNTKGSVGTAGTYDLNYFENASPAQRQMLDNSIPNVVATQGELLVLDIQTWPTDWDTGKIVVVRMPSGVVEYRRLVLRVNLSDGQLAIYAPEASLLEAISDGQMDISGDLAATGSLTKLQSQAKLVDVVDIRDSRTFYVVNKTDVYPDALSFSQTQGGASFSFAAGFPEISLSVAPTINIQVVIDKDLSWSDVARVYTDFISTIITVTADVVDQFGAKVESTPDGLVVSDVDTETARQIADAIASAGDFAEKLDAVVQGLTKRERIKNLTAEVEGSVDGTILFAADATGTYFNSVESPPFAVVLVPITGPVPIFLEFNVLAVAGIDFKADFHADTGVTATIPFYAGVKIQNGEFLDSSASSAGPTFTFLPVSLDGTKGQLTVSAGVQVEAGITLAKLAGAHVDPTAEIIFEAAGEVNGTVTDGCANLSWDVYASLNAEAEAELTIPGLKTDPFKWESPAFTLYEGEWPNSGDHPLQWCWGGGICGDETCNGNETCSSCPGDCGACGPVCGNGTCESGETCSSCASDCGACGPVCGNGTCESGETCSSCPDDCGACGPECGNGTCETGEDCSSCPGDCGTCSICGDGVCQADEDDSSCFQDCNIAEVYQEVTSTTERISVFAWDTGTEDGDRVDILLNGVVTIENVTLTNAGANYTLTLAPGRNAVDIKALNTGSWSPNTAGFTVTDENAQELISADWGMDTGQISRLIVVYQP